MGPARMKEESMAERITVRTTMRPDLDVEMDPVEAEDLRRQGLLVPVEDQPADQPVGKPARPAEKGEKA